MDATQASMREWPSSGIEDVPCCPVCHSTQVRLFLEDLQDVIFCSAPGEWRMCRCGVCRTVYLNPRPTAATIHAAYKEYYTHAPEGQYSATSPQDTSAGASTSRNHSSILKRLVRDKLSGVSEDYELRVGRPPFEGACLLDVGCGNGGYLSRASSLGWEPYGCDFDPAAVRTARHRGVDVRLGGIETFLRERNRFDAITISHVIEHVHEPRRVLATCFELLKENGVLFIDTPNADAKGLSIYGRHWRGLEIPRHLQIWNWSGLEDCLADAGFTSLRRMPQRGISLSVWLASDRIRSGASPYDVRASPSWRFWLEIPRLLILPEDRTEFVTISARKI